MNCDEPDSFSLSHTIIFKFIDIKFSFTLLSNCTICYILRILRLLYLLYFYYILFIFINFNIFIVMLFAPVYTVAYSERLFLLSVYCYFSLSILINKFI